MIFPSRSIWILACAGMTGIPLAPYAERRGFFFYSASGIVLPLKRAVTPPSISSSEPVMSIS